MPDQSLNEYRASVLALKRALKERGITYRELGEGIGLSESGVKKIFAAQDGSFQRLAEICKFIGISLVEIVESRQMVDVGFSEDQQSEFMRDHNLFYLYWLLAYERRSVEESQKVLRLDDSQTFPLLRKLDQMKLLKLLPGERLRLPSIKAVRWRGDGEFVRKAYRSWSKAMMESLAKPEEKDGELFVLRYFQMTSSTYTEFLSAVRSLEQEFLRRSIREMRTRPEKLKHVRWLAAADNRSFIEDRQVIDSDL